MESINDSNTPTLTCSRSKVASPLVAALVGVYRHNGFEVKVNQRCNTLIICLNFKR